MKWFRQCDRRYPFFWESADQPPARWHGPDEGPTQYLADTPEGAWAEFLRHEEMTDPGELQGISRALWTIDDGEEALTAAAPSLPRSVLTGGPATYPRCRAEALHLRAGGSSAIIAPSAALRASTAQGYTVQLGFRSVRRAASVLVLFGRRPELVGWLVVLDGRPPVELLSRIRHLTEPANDDDEPRLTGSAGP